MADLLSIGYFISLIIDVIIITIILYITDKFLAHEVSLKHSAIMAVIAYLAAPLVLAYSGISIPFAVYIIPLIVWIILGELLLKGSRGGRMKAAAVAFIIFLILNFAGVPTMLTSAIPF
ncbi:MAG: hypothetical protein NT120_00150 [Candidatus Aenigmarchaeota archaeon]|nr:hypothetical protein [Candidatus Aenigmarchaeota archaeon]